VLSQATKSALKTFAKENGLTLNTLVQGAWALLLGRHSGTEDVVFGAVRAGRRSTVPDADSIVGLFINTVPVRARLEADAPLVPWLRTLREEWVVVRDHEHTPLAKIQSWSEVPAGQPLFETVVSFQDPSWDAALRAQGGAWAQREFGVRNQPNYPLALDVYVGDDLRAKLFYDRRRFDDNSMARLLGHFRTMLEAMPFSPRRGWSNCLGSRSPSATSCLSNGTTRPLISRSTSASTSCLKNKPRARLTRWRSRMEITKSPTVN